MITRGERNGNPGNLERVPGVHWVGQSADQSADPRFVVFDDALMGIRALAKTLLTYYRKHQRDTVRKIINRWAPNNENDTEAYVSHVASLLSVQPDDAISPEVPHTLQVLVKAIITHENGRCVYDDAVIADGVARALA